MFWTKILYFRSIVQGLEQSKGKKACFGTHSLMITAHMQTTENNYSWLATTQNGHIFFRDTPQQYKHDNTFLLMQIWTHVCNNNPLVFIVFFTVLLSFGGQVVQATWVTSFEVTFFLLFWYLFSRNFYISTYLVARV